MIGLGTGIGCMVIMSVLVFIFLVFKKRLNDKKQGLRRSSDKGTDESGNTSQSTDHEDAKVKDDDEEKQSSIVDDSNIILFSENFSFSKRVSTENDNEDGKLTFVPGLSNVHNQNELHSQVFDDEPWTNGSGEYTTQVPRVDRQNIITNKPRHQSEDTEAKFPGHYVTNNKSRHISGPTIDNPPQFAIGHIVNNKHRHLSGNNQDNVSHNKPWQSSGSENSEIRRKISPSGETLNFGIPDAPLLQNHGISIHSPIYPTPVSARPKQRRISPASPTSVFPNQYNKHMSQYFFDQHRRQLYRERHYPRSRSVDELERRYDYDPSGVRSRSLEDERMLFNISRMPSPVETTQHPFPAISRPMSLHLPLPEVRRLPDYRGNRQSSRDRPQMQTKSMSEKKRRGDVSEWDGTEMTPHIPQSNMVYGYPGAARPYTRSLGNRNPFNAHWQGSPTRQYAFY